MLHFGTLRGVLSYDGAWWRVTPLPNESAVFSVAAGRGPEIAVGAYGEMGYVTRDPHGALTYRSLIPQLPAEFRDVGDVRSVCATAGGFLFVGERALISWSGGPPRVFTDFRATPNPPNRCSGDYLFGGDGLQRAGSPLVLLRGRKIESAIAFDETRVLAAVANEGLYLVDGASATPFAAEASEWLRGKTVIAATRAGERIVLGTRLHGILVLDRNGAIEQRLDVGAGLPPGVLAGVLTDREGVVWLAYHGPIVRLDLTSPVTLLDERSGLHGTTNAVLRNRGRLYIGTSHGLFVDGRMLDGVPSPVWTLAVAHGALLAGTGDGLFVIADDDSSRRIDGTEGQVVYDLLHSKAEPATMWVAARKGIGTLRHDGGAWRFAGLIPGTPRYTRSPIELDGVLWIGSIFDGLVRFDGTNVRTYGRGEVNTSFAGGKIVAVSEERFMNPGENGTLVPDARLQHVAGNYFRVAEDAKGDLWTNSTPPQFIRRHGDGRYGEPVPLVSIDAANIQLVQADADGTIWFAGDEALYRYDSTIAATANPQPRPLIQRAVAADGRSVTAPLPYSFRRLRIEFAPLAYQPGIHYQYRLGTDESWSAWTTEPSIDYTNLDAGEHVFHLRTRSAAGALSPETTWRFTVLPPWYRTRPALLLWIITAALLIAAIVRLRTNALRRQAEKLLTLVAERTEDLQQANAHLERLSLLDELTGIANRRYFQRALVEDWQSALELKQPLALIIIDLDHFKQLNDQHGHPAGDAALVQVARFLARQSRRSGEMPRPSDIVARIGGEEFGVLIANTTEEDAMREAERLRVGITLLPIAVTASCGVASVVPFETEGWQTLVQHADRALYAAKAAGRNCVRAASEAPGSAMAV